MDVSPLVSPLPHGEGMLAAGVSPSLFEPSANGFEGPPAFEIKFLLGEGRAREVETAIAGPFALDPHADPELGGAYRITSLYTDTSEYAVFRRLGAAARSKFRARRYGSGGPAFLERKDRNGDRVRKTRRPIPIDQIPLLGETEILTGWPGEWYHREIVERGLRPVCRIAYDRRAYYGVVEGMVARVTFDRRVIGEAVPEWDATPVPGGAELFPDEVICEFKFRIALPLFLKEVVQSWNLTPSAVSKYRQCARAVGIAPEPRGPEGSAADA